ncbi:uncharacterized protein C17orf113-like [Mustelus asterias]
MPSVHPLIQQDVVTQHKPKRIKQEEVSMQPAHNCQFYTAPLDLRSQREMPGTSNESPATGNQSKAERVQTEEDSCSHTYQLYKVSSDQQFTSDSSDISSDEGTLTQPSLHRVASTHHTIKRVKEEESPQQPIHSYSFYRGPGELPDHRHKASPSDNPSDEIMRTKTPIYRTVVGRNRHERILEEEESLPKAHQSKSIPSYKGKQTLAQVLQQLGAQFPSRGPYSELPGSHSIDPGAEVSHNQYGGQARDDSMSKKRSQFYKGENSYAAGLHSAKTAEIKVQEECYKKAELAATCALRNVYFAAKEMIPNSSTEALNELCIIQGLTDLSGLHSDKLISYDESIEEFQQAITEVTDEGILKRARSSNCFSILIDESEDCFTEPCLFMYLRIIEQVTGGYKPKTYFLAVKKLQEEVTADKITAQLVDVLKEKDLDMKQMCGFAIDGSAVTAECKNSVVSQLKAQAPGLLSIHCIAHRLALSSVSAADTVPYLVKYQQTLDSIYQHFVNLPKNRDGLEAMQKVLRDTHKDSSPFKDIFPSRWLTVRASVEAVIRNFGNLVSALQNSQSARSAGLAKTICTYKFLHCSHFLADILHQLYILCKSYQTSNTDFSIVHPLLKSTVTTINKLGAERTGEMLKNLLAALPPNLWDDSLSDCSFMFQNHRIKGGRHQRTEAENTCRTFLENLTRDLQARFSESNDAATITAMTAIFDPAHASDSKNRHIQTVTDYLSSLSDESDKDDFEMSCKQELVSFMNFVESQPGVHALTNAKDVCKLALKQKLMFPMVSSLAERYLALPIPTADLAGVFSRQHVFRTKLGNSLSSKSLENLIKISIHGPPIKEFNFVAAYSKWASSKAQQQKS